MDMKVLKSDYRYAIIVIDSFSKLADAEPIKDKQTETVYKNLLKNFSKNGLPFKCV